MGAAPLGGLPTPARWGSATVDSAPRVAGLTLPAEVHHAFQGSRHDSPTGGLRCLQLPLSSAEPSGVLALTALRIPESLFPTETPAGRRSSTSEAPGGQPDPSTSAAGGACVEQLRWARCPDDARAPLRMGAAGGGLGVPDVIQRGNACAGEPASLPVRTPGAHLHPLLRRPAGPARVGSAGSGA